MPKLITKNVKTFCNIALYLSILYTLREMFGMCIIYFIDKWLVKVIETFLFFI